MAAAVDHRQEAGAAQGGARTSLVALSRVSAGVFEATSGPEAFAGDFGVVQGAGALLVEQTDQGVEAAGRAGLDVLGGARS